jgi:hypothetical protein
MAKVIYGGVGLQGLSGSINKQAGGHTFTKNNVVRRRVVPVNPKTEDQQAIRSAFSFLTTAWSETLTDPQRQAWETARTEAYYQKQDKLNGVSRPFASSKDLFVGMNINYLLATNAISSPSVAFSTPAAPETLDSITAVSVAIDASAQTVAMSFTGTWSGETGFIKMTPPVAAGNMKASTVSTKSRIIGEDFGSSPAALGSDYTNRFGALTGATGKKVFWELYGVNNTTGKTRLIASGTTVVVA